MIHHPHLSSHQIIHTIYKPRRYTTCIYLYAHPRTYLLALDLHPVAAEGPVPVQAQALLLLPLLLRLFFIRLNLFGCMWGSGVCLRMYAWMYRSSQLTIGPKTICLPLPTNSIITFANNRQKHTTPPNQQQASPSHLAGGRLEGGVVLLQELRLHALWVVRVVVDDARKKVNTAVQSNPVHTYTHATGPPASSPYPIQSINPTSPFSLTRNGPRSSSCSAANASRDCTVPKSSLGKAGSAARSTSLRVCAVGGVGGNELIDQHRSCGE